MDFENHFRNACIGDISDIDVPIPEDMVERLRSWFGEYQDILVNLAVHFYGDKPTAEHIAEAGMLIMMWERKELGCAYAIGG